MRSTTSRGSTWLVRDSVGAFDTRAIRTLAALGTLAGLDMLAALAALAALAVLTALAALAALDTRAPGSLTPTCRGAEVSEHVRVVSDREVGETLRRAGLNTRALSAWAGTDRLAALPSLLSKLVENEPTPAAAALAMFVGGARVPIRKLTLIGHSLAALVRRGLVEIEEDRARAKVAISPLGSSLFVCDRPDATVREELVCWPDDSSHHLAACLPPGRREKWLDLGCGSGFAPLARPELATSICGTDINTRALDHAALGAALSGVRLEVFDGDVGANVPASWRGSCELVSCNAPIPAAANISRTTPAAETFAGTAPVWRHAASDVVERMVDAAASFAARDATIVLHAAHDALAAVLARRRGDRTIVRYTPDDVSGFAVAWWQPDGEERLVERVRLLTRDAPHLTFDDR